LDWLGIMNDAVITKLTRDEKHKITSRILMQTITEIGTTGEFYK